MRFTSTERSAPEPVFAEMAEDVATILATLNNLITDRFGMDMAHTAPLMDVAHAALLARSVHLQLLLLADHGRTT
jgi:hypothetical protein